MRRPTAADGQIIVLLNPFWDSKVSFPLLASDIEFSDTGIGTYDGYNIFLWMPLADPPPLEAVSGIPNCNTPPNLWEDRAIEDLDL